MAPSKTSSRVPQPQEPNKTGFLDLAAEMRNTIYTYWAQDILNVGICAKGKAHTIGAHPATQISRLVHQEFCGLLGHISLTNAQRVKVHIIDLNFYPLMTFLNRVIARPGADYHDFKHGDGRQLIIELEFTDAFWKTPPSEEVAKWFRYVGRKVPGLEYEMRVIEVEDRAKTRKTIYALMSGGEVCKQWEEIVSKFREWEWDKYGMAERMQREVAALAPVEKSDMEKAVDDYYDAIYKQMDARDQGVGNNDYVEEKVEVKEEQAD